VRKLGEGNEQHARLGLDILDKRGILNGERAARLPSWTSVQMFFTIDWGRCPMKLQKIPAQAGFVKKMVDGVEKRVATLNATIELRLPENLADALKWAGEAVVFGIFMKQVRIMVQALMRPMMEEGKTAAEIQATLAEWKPGVRLEKQALTVDKALEMVLTGKTELTAEQKAAMRKLLDGK
jgi:archaeosine-15-forming tRNA-guanine transglycosylase